MDKTLSLTVSVADGRLQPTQQAKAVIGAFLKPMDGKTVTINFRKPTKSRSGQQNRYYWGVLLSMMALETGHTSEELHEWCKATFLPRTHVKVGGIEVEMPKSTTSLSTIEFENYLEQLRAFAGEVLGMIIPLPNEVTA